MPRVLFVLKHRNNYGEWSYAPQSGLYNSALFVVDELVASGVEAKLVQVVDNNDIDREVTAYNPTHVIIEALWVVPSKFQILTKLHPSVNWIIRIHSEVPFLAMEGIATEWIKAYVNYPKVSVAFNSQRTYDDFAYIIPQGRLYLPNYYPVSVANQNLTVVFNVGCFGAIRPLKNQLIQAVAAIEYADLNKKTLYFHINASRQEQQGYNVYKNIKALFNGTKHILVEHPWMDRTDFLNLISEMNVSMAVSLTETFNICAADSVSRNVPLVCSAQVPFASPQSTVDDPTSVKEIVQTMDKVLGRIAGKFAKIGNIHNLKNYSKDSRVTWLKYLGIIK